MTGELFPFLVLISGIFLAASGYVWLLHNVFDSHQGWGHLLYFLPVTLPICVLVFWRRSLLPFLVLLVGVATSSSPIVLKKYFIDLGPYRNIVKGELHLTLTKWDENDYSVLTLHPDVVVLQMANEDVTDETLQYLKGRDKLRKLDLESAKITDAGLAVLSDLPNLQFLKLKGTEITDEGLKHLQKIQSLQELDLSGTAITDNGLLNLSELKNLKTLILEYTKLTDEGFRRNIFKLKSRPRVSVQGSGVKGKTGRDWNNKKLTPHK